MVHPNIVHALLAAVASLLITRIKVGDTQLYGASPRPIMSFNPLSLLILKFRGRSVAVFRDHCTRYEVSPPNINFRQSLIASLAQSILAVAQSNFRDLQGVPIENIVLLSTIPDYPDRGQVELSKETWPTVSAIVHSVMIALESGAFPSGLLDDSM